MTDKSIDLTIIIPHYNSASTLDRLLNSIGDIRQQVIVVDDRSTEDWEWVKSKHPDVEFMVNTGKKGPGTARNQGLEHAKGKWVMFADSDDYMLDGWYDIVSGLFDSADDIIFFPPDNIDIDTGSHDQRRNRWYAGVCRRCVENGEEWLVRSKYSVPWGKLIRRSLIEDNKIRFYEIMQCEDTMFSARCGYLAGSVSVVMKEIYCVVEHSGSLTHIMSKDAFETRTRIMAEEYEFWKDKPGYEGIKGICYEDARRFMGRARKYRYGLSTYIQTIKKFKAAGIPLKEFMPYEIKQCLRSPVYRLKKLFGRV